MERMKEKKKGKMDVGRKEVGKKLLNTICIRSDGFPLLLAAVLIQP